jgi:hypothetical protein
MAVMEVVVAPRVWRGGGRLREPDRDVRPRRERDARTAARALDEGGDEAGEKSDRERGIRIDGGRDDRGGEGDQCDDRPADPAARSRTAVSTRRSRHRSGRRRRARDGRAVAPPSSRVRTLPLDGPAPKEERRKRGRKREDAAVATVGRLLPQRSYSRVVRGAAGSCVSSDSR